MKRVLLFYITAQTLVATDLCSQVMTLNCETKYVAAENEGVCGTNGKSYENYCLYAQAKCQDGHINIQYVGLCKNWTENEITSNNFTVSVVTTSTDNTSFITTTTVDNFTETITTKVTPVATDYDPLKRVFCTSILTGTIKCTDELDPYCGTDGHFYMNRCHFEMAKCINDTLLQQPLNFCKGTIPNGQT